MGYFIWFSRQLKTSGKITCNGSGHMKNEDLKVSIVDSGQIIIELLMTLSHNTPGPWCIFKINFETQIPTGTLAGTQ